MEIEQFIWKPLSGWNCDPGKTRLDDVSLILVFGAPLCLTTASPLLDLHNRFPQSQMAGCSTAGEIFGTTVFDNTLTATLISFKSTTVKSASVNMKSFSNFEEAGSALATQIPHENLTHLLVFADGVEINGSELIRGIHKVVPPDVSITGGLAGDGADFKRSYTVFNCDFSSNSAVVVGLYGTNLIIGTGSRDGWIPFGPKRLITSSVGNQLFSLDGQPALELYKKYLGKEKKNLPASGLLFPLRIEDPETKSTVIRSITGTNEESESIEFAGDMPKGAYAQLMRAVNNDIIEGATLAATDSLQTGSSSPELTLLVSCIGRKSILKQLTEEETEAVDDTLQCQSVITGFYSYGEIAPNGSDCRVALHNQTMTITTFSEAY